MAAELLSVLTFHHPLETLTGVLRKCIYLLTAQNDPPQPENEIKLSGIPAAGSNISPVVFTGLLGGRLGL